MLHQIALACFWVSIAVVLYCYALYPGLIWVLARLFGRCGGGSPPDDPRSWPKVTLLIAAYNERGVIAGRIRNALMMDYPADRFDVVVGLDGCTDGMRELLRPLEERGVRVLEYPTRRGKAEVLKSSLEEIVSPIVLMSDANTEIDPQAVRRLVRWFQHPDVGVVVGRLVLKNASGGRTAEPIYWRCEDFLKRCENRLGGLLGANGAIYAIRRDLFVPPPPGTIVDDLVIPLMARLEHGCSIIYEAEAEAHEEAAWDVGDEFSRRTRIGAGGFHSLSLLWRLLYPRGGWISFTFFSHKVLRWFCPFFLVLAVAANALLCARPFYRWTLAAQLAFYGGSLFASLVPARWELSSPMRLSVMFTYMNAALLVGFVRWLLGRQGGTWNRTPRVPEGRGIAHDPS